jgi:hypothetical protein
MLKKPHIHALWGTSVPLFVASYDEVRQGSSSSDPYQQVPLYVPLVVIIIFVFYFQYWPELVSSSRVHDLGRIMSDIFLKPSFYKIKRKGEANIRRLSVLVTQAWNNESKQIS